VSDFNDTALGVRGVFMEGAGPRLELVSDLPGEGVVQPWLRRQAAMYHLAFEVADVSVAIAAASARGARVVTRPTPSVAFGGRPIAFVMLRNGALVELIASASNVR
jgi:methylmalonyl-CoA/ethylmalonyl-CoA epimerase